MEVSGWNKLEKIFVVQTILTPSCHLILLLELCRWGNDNMKEILRNQVVPSSALQLHHCRDFLSRKWYIGCPYHHKLKYDNRQLIHGLSQKHKKSSSWMLAEKNQGWAYEQKTVFWKCQVCPYFYGLSLRRAGWLIGKNGDLRIVQPRFESHSRQKCLSEKK